MKKNYSIILVLLLFYSSAFAQSGSKDFESKRMDCSLNSDLSKKLFDALNNGDVDIQKAMKAIFADSVNVTTSNKVAANLYTGFRKEISMTLADIEKGKNAAVIVIYRKLLNGGALNGTTEYQVDLSNLNTTVIHGKVNDFKYDNYLLATKRVYVILVDLHEKVYLDDQSKRQEKLSLAKIDLVYRQSKFSQSFKEVVNLFDMGGGDGDKLTLTLIKINPDRIKDPCDIVVSHPKFPKDLVYTIHEQNLATFQVGVTNSKIAVKNISLTGNDLVVKPDDQQKKDWKGSAYALLELHLPRDIDRFQPLWKSIFNGNAKYANDRNFGDYLYDITLSRIGIYAGIKLAKDPFSNLYAGLNYSITNDFAVNFGWAWANEYDTQVTEIGNITSVDDALKFAKRSYGKGDFSIGISFAPSIFAKTLGLKTKSEDSGN
ncbi:hypothetical protein ACTJKN_25730 [Pedobacter sp. 22163]|uniref:hypothetical protein n=1 Tax=Pedobacter sp. 22163 TaxID=3453883 RepID=UPI003F85F5AB